MADYNYVPRDKFDPETQVYWQPVGEIISWSEEVHTDLRSVVFRTATGHSLIFSLLSPTACRVRFDPNPDHVFEERRSPVIKTYRIEKTDATISEDARVLTIDTGKVVFRIALDHYKLMVYRDGQLIHSDTDNFNLVYIPDQQVVANFKKAPLGSRYFGFGEKAGTTLDKRRVPDWHFREGSVPNGNFGWLSGAADNRKPARMTFFNFDNFGYRNRGLTAPKGENAGPLNPNVPLYQSSPFWLDVNPAPDGEFHGPPYTTAILFDNTCQSFVNLRGGHPDWGDTYYFGALYGEMDYYLFTGPTHAEILDEVTKITGKPRLKPRWVFGFHQGGYGPNYNDQYQLLERAKEYREHRIPIDGLHIDIDIQDKYRNFSVSRKRFADARDVFRKLHESGYKLSTNVTPLISNMKDEHGQASPYEPLDTGSALGSLVSDLRVGGGGANGSFVGTVNYGGDRIATGNYPDLGKSEFQKWWGDLYHFWVDLGLDMVWQDMTTPCMEGDGTYRSIPMDCSLWDNEESRFNPVPMPSQKLPFAKTRNLFSFNLVKSTFEGLERLRGNLRNFIIARGGFFGEHRYAAVWTGDNVSEWEFVIANIPQVLNMGLSAQPICGADIGGFGGNDCEAELLVRWTCAGAFLPWFRNHYGHYGNKTKQEPYRYGDPVAAVCRRVIELRYRLIQIFYDAMHENHENGAPIVRPLFWESKDPAVFECHDWWYWSGNGRGFHYNNCRLDDQFFLGHDLLIAPIVLPQWVTGDRMERPVYLPADTRWYAFKDNRFPLDPPIEGGVQFSYYSPWNRAEESYPNFVPIYVREGAVLATRELEQFVGERYSKGDINPLTFTIYSGRSGSRKTFLDDGETLGAENDGKLRIVEVSHKRSAKGRFIHVLRLKDGFKPLEPFYFIAVLDPLDPISIQIGWGPVASVTRIEEQTDEGSSHVLFNSETNCYYFNRSLKATFIKVFDTHSDVTIELIYS